MISVAEVFLKNHCDQKGFAQSFIDTIKEEVRTGKHPDLKSASAYYYLLAEQSLNSTEKIDSFEKSALYMVLGTCELFNEAFNEAV